MSIAIIYCLIVTAIFACQCFVIRALRRDKALIEQRTGYRVTPDGRLHEPTGQAKCATPYGE